MSARKELIGKTWVVWSHLDPPIIIRFNRDGVFNHYPDGPYWLRDNWSHKGDLVLLTKDGYQVGSFSRGKQAGTFEECVGNRTSKWVPLLQCCPRILTKATLGPPPPLLVYDD